MRKFSNFYWNGKRMVEEFFTYHYILWFENDKLVEVRNQSGYACETESDTWDYFSKIYAAA